MPEPFVRGIDYTVWKQVNNGRVANIARWTVGAACFGQILVATVNNQLFPVRALLNEGVSKGNWPALERTNLLLTRSRNNDF